MYQQEIKFFWPLTEQIPLDLDYENCSKFKGLSIPTVNGSVGQTLAFSSGASPTWSTTVKSDEVETKRLSIVLDKKPNFMLRWVYKLLNINWKI
jgi:hypothetical protein